MSEGVIIFGLLVGAYVIGMIAAMLGSDKVIEDLYGLPPIDTSKAQEKIWRKEMSSGFKEEHKKQNKITRRKERLRNLTEDPDFVWLMHDNDGVDNMSDQEILKEYKRYKKANPNGMNWEEL